MTYDEAMAQVREGRRARCPRMTRGWYVYCWPGVEALYVHNPYHGDGPSGRDHQFEPASEEYHRDTKWTVE